MRDDLDHIKEGPSLDELLQEIDQLSSLSPEAMAKETPSTGRHFATAVIEANASDTELSVEMETEEDPISETAPTVPQDTVVLPSGAATGVPTDSGGTKVMDLSSHELYFSMGQKPAEPGKRTFSTEEYEPEEYGLSDDKFLSFISRGVRQIRNVKPEDSEEPEHRRHRPEIEYTSPDKRDEIMAHLRKARMSDALRAVFTLLLSLPLLWLGLSDSLSLPVPAFLLSNPLLCSCVILGLTTAVIGVNILPLCRALRDLFTGKPNVDCPLVFAGLASLLLPVIDLCLPGEAGLIYPPLCASFALAAFCSAIWRGLYTNAVTRSFAVVAGNRQKGVLVPIEDERLCRNIMGSMIIGGPLVYKPERTDFVTDFLHHSASSNTASRCTLILTYLSIPLSAVTVLLTLFRGGGLREAVYAAACAFFAFLPLTMRLVSAIPYYRATKRVTAASSAIVGYHAAEQVGDIGAAVIDSNHLFPAGSLSLDAMRTFSTLRIDDAIVDAASVVCAAGGALSRIFLEVIDDRRDLLRHVDSLLYEDGLGLSAWVNEKRVLVGTAELLRGHGVSVPSRDYEARYRSSGQNLVYISVAGNLTAMFVISYHARQEIYDTLFELRQAGVGLVIINRDCNITSDMICRLFDFPSKLIHIMTPSNERLLGESMEERCSAGIVYSKGLIGVGRTILSSLRLIRSVSLATAVQTGGLLLTAMLTVYLAATGGILDMTLVELLTCQGVFGLLTVLSVLLRRS